MEYNFLHFTDKKNSTYMDKYNGPIITKKDPFLTSAAPKDAEAKKIECTLLSLRSKARNTTSFIPLQESDGTTDIQHRDIPYLAQKDLPVINTESSDSTTCPTENISNAIQNDINENPASVSTDPIALDKACSSSPLNENDNVNYYSASSSIEPMPLDNSCSSSTDNSCGVHKKRPAPLTFHSPGSEKIILLSNNASTDTGTQTTISHRVEIKKIQPSTTTFCTISKNMALQPTTSSSTLTTATLIMRGSRPSQSESHPLLQKIRIFTSDIKKTYVAPSPTYTLEFLFDILKNFNRTYPTIAYSQEHPDVIIGEKSFDKITAVCQACLGSYGTPYKVSNPIAELIIKQIDTRIKFATQIKASAISVPHTYSDLLTQCIMTHMEIIRTKLSQQAFIESIDIVTFDPSIFNYFQYKDTNPLHVDLSLKIGIAFLHECLFFLYFASSQKSKTIVLSHNISVTLQMLLQTFKDHDINIPTTLLAHTTLPQDPPMIHVEDAKWIIQQLEELLFLTHMPKLCKQSEGNSTYLIDLLLIKDTFYKANFYTGPYEAKISLTPRLQQAVVSCATAIKNRDQQEKAIDDKTSICQAEKQALEAVATTCAGYHNPYTAGYKQNATVYISKSQTICMLSLIDKCLQQICFPSKTTNSDTNDSIISEAKQRGVDSWVLFKMQSVIQHNMKCQQIFLPIRFVMILRSFIRACRRFDNLFPFYLKLHLFLSEDAHVIGKKGQRLSKEQASNICDLIYKIHTNNDKLDLI